MTILFAEVTVQPTCTS